MVVYISPTNYRDVAIFCMHYYIYIYILHIYSIVISHIYGDVSVERIHQYTNNLQSQ